METSAPLLLGAFIGAIIIYFASYSVSALLASKRIAAQNGVAVQNHAGPSKIFIPDTLATWPWPRLINPHYAELEKETTAWLESFRAFSPRAQRAFNRGGFNRLGCMILPTASKEHARAGCGLINLVFVVDEYTDVDEPHEVRKKTEIVMDALRNPHKPRPKGEWIGGEVARQYWERTARYASKQSQKRFIQTFGESLEAVVQQAIDRDGHRIRDVKSYMDIRRETIGTKASFALLEQAFDIPDDVISHPAIEEMSLAAVDMTSLDNDILSYNLEQSRGDDGHNIITLAMKEFGTDVNGALLWALDYYTELQKTFHAAMKALPELEEPLNSQVKEYCNGLAIIVRANHDWSYESGRYFGDRGMEIMQKKWMSLMPKERKNDTREIGPVLVDSSLL